MSTDNPLKALLAEIQKVEKRRVKKALTWEALGEEIQNAANGGTPPVDGFVPGSPIPPIPNLNFQNCLSIMARQA